MDGGRAWNAWSPSATRPCIDLDASSEMKTVLTNSDVGDYGSRALIEADYNHISSGDIYQQAAQARDIERVAGMYYVRMR